MGAALVASLLTLGACGGPTGQDLARQCISLQMAEHIPLNIIVKSFPLLDSWEFDEVTLAQILLDAGVPPSTNLARDPAAQDVEMLAILMKAYPAFSKGVVGCSTGR